LPRRKIPRSIREQRIAEQIAAEREAEDKPQPLVLRSGEKINLEEDAEKLLAADRRKAESKDKTDYFSREQMILRRNREVYSTNGVPDASLISGMYKRTYNPEYGNRPNRSKGGDD
jgi:hypothetical protein